jgi:hypothetical protein
VARALLPPTSSGAAIAEIYYSVGDLRIGRVQKGHRLPFAGNFPASTFLNFGGNFFFRGVVRVHVLVENVNELGHDAITLQRGE